MNQSDEKITIEVEYGSGGMGWMAIQQGVVNSPQAISHALKQAKRSYPDKKARAIGMKSKRLYDMSM